MTPTALRCRITSPRTPLLPVTTHPAAPAHSCGQSSPAVNTLRVAPKRARLSPACGTTRSPPAVATMLVACSGRAAAQLAVRALVRHAAPCSAPPGGSARQLATAARLGQFAGLARQQCAAKFGHRLAARPGGGGCARGLRTTPVTMGLKTGIVGLPNVGKVRGRQPQHHTTQQVAVLRAAGAASLAQLSSSPAVRDAHGGASLAAQPTHAAPCHPPRAPSPPCSTRCARTPRHRPPIFRSAPSSRTWALSRCLTTGCRRSPTFPARVRAVGDVGWSARQAHGIVPVPGLWWWWWRSCCLSRKAAHRVCTRCAPAHSSSRKDCAHQRGVCGHCGAGEGRQPG